MAEQITDPPIRLADPAHERYATLDLVGWWDHDRVRRARVVVVGAGALGNEVLKNLALIGVGSIAVFDFDDVEASNLTRSVLYRQKDVGRSKARVAAERVTEINSDVRAVGFDGNINFTLGAGLVASADVVIGCVDNREARLLLNTLCTRIGQTWVDAAIADMHGEVRVFGPGEGACYECTLTDRDYAEISRRYSCMALGHELIEQRRIPTTATTASILGGIESQEAIKVLHGKAADPGTIVVYGGWANEAYVVSPARRETCFGHDRFDRVVSDHSLSVGSPLDDLARRLEHHWPGDDVDLTFDHELILELECVACDQRETVWAFLPLVPMAGRACSTCDAVRLARTTHRLSTAMAAANRPPVTLGAMGLAPWHVLAVETPTEWVGLELAGDSTRWPQQHVPQPNRLQQRGTS